MKTNTEEPQELLENKPRFNELMDRVRAASVGKAVSASEWQEIVDGLYEIEEAAESRLQAEFDKGRLAGEQASALSLKSKLMEEAAQCFMHCKDELATELRRIAQKLNS